MKPSEKRELTYSKSLSGIKRENKKGGKKKGLKCMVTARHLTPERKSNNKPVDFTKLQ